MVHLEPPPPIDEFLRGQKPDNAQVLARLTQTEGQMARGKKLDDTGVLALKPRSKRYAHPDPELASHYIRVTPSGAKCGAAHQPNETGFFPTMSCERCGNGQRQMERSAL